MNKAGLKISVALCTFNGAHYLPAQLESLQLQECPVDEIVCCDDQSTDDTQQLFENFALTFNGEARFIKNETRLGPRLNFEKAISFCTGDFIFLCDQDDRWFPDKIAQMAGYLYEHPEAGGLFCNGGLMDTEGVALGETMWDALYFEESLRKRTTPENLLYYLLLNGNIVTGTAFGFRKEFISQLLPFFTISNTWHDHWLALVLAAEQKLHFLDKPLLQYRIHPGQQVGFKGRGQSNPGFRHAVHQTWLYRTQPDPDGLKTTHLAWGLMAYDRYAPELMKRLSQTNHLVATHAQMTNDFRVVQKTWLRQIPFYKRKWKLLKHWLHGGEYQRIGWKELVNI
jgi:glycosyltransferase involved in cell wall biosynthesis